MDCIFASLWIISNGMTEERLRLFESERISTAVLKLAVPTVLSSLVMTIYSLADTFFVGMLGDSVQNAAVTLSAPVLLAFNAINNLFGVGASSMMSRALGRKDYQSAYRSSSFGLYCALICSAAFSSMAFFFNDQLLLLIGADEVTIEATRGYIRWTVVAGAAPSILNVVFAYLVRAEGSAMHASIGTMSGCFLNIILDPIFVLPQFLGMGAEGAGLATMISNCAAVLYFIVLVISRGKDTYVAIDPRHLSWKPYIIMGVCAVGIPASIQNLLNVTGMTILNNFTSAYGADAVAAMGIAQRLNNVPFSLANGFTQGVMPLVSYTFASGDHARMRNAISFTAKIVISALLGVAILYYAAAPLLISAFMRSPVIVEYGTRFLRGFCLGVPLLAVDFLAVGVFQAVGKGAYSLVFAIARKVVLEIPAIFILNHLFPLYGLSYAQASAESVMAMLAVVMLLYLLHGIGDGRIADGGPARRVE